MFCRSPAKCVLMHHVRGSSLQLLAAVLPALGLGLLAVHAEEVTQGEKGHVRNGFVHGLCEQCTCLLLPNIAWLLH